MMEEGPGAAPVGFDAEGHTLIDRPARAGFDPDGTWVLTRSAETTGDGQVVVDYPLDLDGSTYTASLRVEAPSAWLVDTEDGPGGTVVLEDGPYPFVREE